MRRGVAWLPRTQPRMLDYLEHDDDPEVRRANEGASERASLPPANFIDHRTQRIRPIQRSQRVPAPAYEPMLTRRPPPMVTLGPGADGNPFPFSTQIPEPRGTPLAALTGQTPEADAGLFIGGLPQEPMRTPQAPEVIGRLPRFENNIPRGMEGGTVMAPLSLAESAREHARTREVVLPPLPGTAVPPLDLNAEWRQAQERARRQAEQERAARQNIFGLVFGPRRR